MAAAVRGRRTDLGLTQEQLARRAGVSRKWIYDFEAGKPTARLGIVMRVLDALDLALDVNTEPASEEGVDLDAILGDHRAR